MSNPLTKCDNCKNVTPLSRLDFIDDFFARTEPGNPIPAGQCTECGALAYIEIIEVTA